MALVKRSCPDCGAKLPLYLRWVFAGAGQQWDCGTCSRRMQCSWRWSLLQG